MMYRSCISGMGHHLPDRIVTNKEIGAMLDVDDEFIVKLTGIHERRWAEKGETVSNLSLQAALKAIEMAGISPEDIDMIIFSSMGSDYQFPGGGCDLLPKLGIAGPPALDIRNACNGFVYGLSVADQYIKTGMYEHILLVGAEIQSTSLDLTPRGKNMSILFGDGAGAAIISRSDSDERGILNTQIYSDGKYADRLIQEAPSPNDHPRLSKELFDTERIYPFMDGRTVFKHAVTRFPEVIMEALEKEGYGIDDLDLIVPHQANLRISEFVARKLGVENGTVFSNIERYGNTTSASIPIALSEAVEQGLVSEGKLICLAAFGAGFAWGSALIRW